MVMESGVPKKVRSFFIEQLYLKGYNALLATFFTLFSCLASSSTLNMKASVDFQRTIRYYIPEDRENVKCETIPVTDHGVP
jgi:hypothetical protein